MTRQIQFLTTCRADFSLLRPIMAAVDASDRLARDLVVTGMHLGRKFGHTVDEIEQSGFTPFREIDLGMDEVDTDTPSGQVACMANLITGLSKLLSSSPPDIAVLLGDRFEMHAAALAYISHKIPIAHIHGGEVTEGAVDDVYRHSLTKMSHIHFAAASEFADRIRQMGEENWRIYVTGAPGLDNIVKSRLPSKQDMSRRYGADFDSPYLLITLHPETVTNDAPGEVISNLLQVLDGLDIACIFTLPNADQGGGIIRKAIERFVCDHERASMVESFGNPYYLAAMAYASAMVGNSSSGVIEAPTLGVPVVNIGSRQDGRPMAQNIISCAIGCDDIAKAITRAVSADFKSHFQGVTNPYGDGNAAARMVEILEGIELGEEFLKKKWRLQVQ